MTENSKAQDLDLAWKNRVLCRDESCIGTIGPDGRCRECGLSYEGIIPDRSETVTGQPHEAAANGELETDAAGDSHSSASMDEPIDGKTMNDVSGSATDDEWERRTLCPDESCIGVIGPDGCCKECGRRK